MTTNLAQIHTRFIGVKHLLVKDQLAITSLASR